MLREGTDQESIPSFSACSSSFLRTSQAATVDDTCAIVLWKVEVVSSSVSLAARSSFSIAATLLPLPLNKKSGNDYCKSTDHTQMFIKSHLLTSHSCDRCIQNSTCTPLYLNRKVRMLKHINQGRKRCRCEGVSHSSSYSYTYC